MIQQHVKTTNGGISRYLKITEEVDSPNFTLRGTRKLLFLWPLNSRQHIVLEGSANFDGRKVIGLTPT